MSVCVSDIHLPSRLFFNVLENTAMTKTNGSHIQQETDQHLQNRKQHSETELNIIRMEVHVHICPLQQQRFEMTLFTNVPQSFADATDP